jgi:hypothetical protein
MSNNEKKSGNGSKKTVPAVEKLLRFLRIHPSTGGLEVTDQLLRLAYFDGAAWQFRAVRLEPGVSEGGKIKDEPAFIAALTALRSQVPQFSKKNSLMNVVVSLGAASIYNQIFSLPLLTGESFDTAMKLNLQMSSSVDAAEAYSGWEIINRNEAAGRVEVLGAFADRAMIDAMTNTLFSAGFVTTTVESKALAVARIMREYGSNLDIEKSYLVIIIDDSGIDFIIVRYGQLCFEYMSPWRDIADEKGEIALDRFAQAFTLDLHQVMNFYRQHWTEPMAAIELAGESLIAEAQAAILAAEQAPIFLLKDALGGGIPDAWIVALGSGLRGTVPKRKDQEITFLGEGAKQLFENSRILGFLSFWRVAVPVILGILFAVFVLTDGFLRTAQKSAATYSASVSTGGTNTQEMTDLTTQAARFNRSVGAITSIEALGMPRYAIVDAVSTAAANDNITVTRITLQSDSEPILVAGATQSESSISTFKLAIEQIPDFTAVNLPLDGVQGTGSSYTFSMTFSEKASGTNGATP